MDAENQNSDVNACVTSTVSVVLVTVARLTAGALFPSITFCMLSKCYASKYILHHSWLTQIIDFEPSHKLHTCERCVSRVRSCTTKAKHLRFCVVLFGA